MADIRIKDLAVTAGSSASDDYLAVDGSTNGTRKLSAYSPTFGGNLAVSGTGSFGGATGPHTFGNGAGAVEVRAVGDSSGYYGYSFYTGGAYESSLKHTSGSGILKLDVGRNSAWGGSFEIYADTTRAARFAKTSTTLDGNLTVSGGSIINGAATSVYFFGTPSANYMYYDGSSLSTRLGGSDRLTISGSTGNATFSNNISAGGYITSNGVYNAGVNSLSAPLLLGGSTNGGDGGYTPRLQVANPSNGDKYVAIGYDNTADMGFLLSVHRSQAWKTLSINPVGGNVLIGTATDLGQKLQVNGAAAISGVISIGNTVQTAAGVASTHKVTISIGGTTYYLLATT